MYISALSCPYSYCQSQYDKVWVMGQNLGLDFNTLPPTVFHFNTHQISTESDASVCNSNGELLFYTNGTFIIDKSENIMPNGSLSFAGTTQIIPTASTSQGTVIVPFIDDTNKYYVLSLMSYENTGTFGDLYYSVVDMNLNGGLGDVVAGQKAILINTGHTEHLTAIPSCEGGIIWILSISISNGSFVSYKIDISGINNTPIYSLPYTTNVGGGLIGISGVISSSRDAKKIAVTKYGFGVSIYDFDQITGMVSNELSLDENSTAYYGSCFSPDDSKVYYNTHNSIFQHDLSLTNNTSIIASKTKVADSVFTTDIKIGLDNKLYFKGYGSTFVGTISFPNLAGLACQANIYALSVVAGTTIRYGLPNYVPTFDFDFGAPITSNTLINICHNTDLELSPINNFDRNYIWNTGSTTKTLRINNPGTYWVKYFNECILYCDTFIISHYTNTNIYPINDSICVHETYQLGNNILNQPGIYNDTFIDQYGCDSIIQLQLSLKQQPNAEIIVASENDCIFDTLIFDSKYTHYQYEWHLNDSFGGNLQTLQIPLNYITNQIKLIATNKNGCIDTTELNIIINACCKIDIPNAFSPNGDGLNDNFAPINYGRIKSYDLLIFNRFGETVFRTSDINALWDGSFKGKPSDVGVYFYYLKGKCFDDSDFIRKGEVTLLR